MKKITKMPDFEKVKEDRERVIKQKERWICPTCIEYTGKLIGYKSVLDVSKKFPFLRKMERLKYKCPDCYTEWTYDR